MISNAFEVLGEVGVPMSASDILPHRKRCRASFLPMVGWPQDRSSNSATLIFRCGVPSCPARRALIACMTSSSSKPARVVATSGIVLKTVSKALSWTARKWLSQIFPTAACRAWPRSGMRDDAELLWEIGITRRADQEPAGLRATFVRLGGRSEPLLGAVAPSQRRDCSFRRPR